MEISKKTMLRLFLVIAAGILFYWITCEMDKVISIFSKIAKIFSPFVTGAIIAFILNVPMRAFERLLRGIKRDGLRRALAIVLTILSVLIVLTAVMILLVPQLLLTILQLATTIQELPAWLTTAFDAIKEYIAKYPQLYTWLMENIDLESLDIGSMVKDMLPKIGDLTTTLISLIISAISSFATGVVNAFLAVVFSIYCLFSKDTLARQGRKILYAFFPELFADRVIRVLRLSNVTFSNFLSGQCVEACILGSLFAVVMAIFNMPYIPLICVLIAVTAFIPIVGALIGCFVGAFLIGVSDPIQAVYFIILSVILQQLENNLIYPRVVGTSIGLPGMWVLVAVSVGGSIMGVGGMFLMIPLSSVVYALFRLYTNKRLSSRDVDGEKLELHPIQFKRKRVIKRNGKKEVILDTTPVDLEFENNTEE